MQVELIYKGKTKDVYRINDNQMLLTFKDDVTGEDGTFDPGANTVGLSIDGIGKSGLRLTTYFFKKLAEEGIPTHYIDADPDQASMTVKDAVMFGNGLEVICRFRAVGSFYRRYGAYCEEGQALNSFVEVTIKDDERGDPPISEDALIELGILTSEEYMTLKHLTIKISQLVREELSKKELELYDIKLEFGKDKQTGKIMLIDEISGGNMRVYKGNKIIDPLVIEKTLLQ